MATTYDINYFIFEIDITEDNTVIQLKNNRRGDTTEWDNITYWGDGTSDTNTTHTYNIGKYTIKSKLFTYRDNESGVNSNRYVTNVFSINKNITDCYRLFYDCNKLTSLDVSNFDTSNVTNMYAMFSNCLSLTSLDVSNFNTSNVTDMRSMFNNCRLLTSLDLSNFDTSNVVTMYTMFYNCKSLTSLNVSSFNTSKITTMAEMFKNCSKLTSLDLSNFNTSNLTNMDSMFYGCGSLTSLDLSNFNTSKVTNMSAMFCNCNKLTSLDLSNFNTSKVISMLGMFRSCSSLTSLDLSNFTINDTVNTDKMFHDTPQLQDIGMVYCTKATIEKVSSLIQHTANIYVNSVIPENCTPVEGITFIYDGNIKEMTHEPLRAVGDVKDRYVLIDGKWYIERNCAYKNSYSILEEYTNDDLTNRGLKLIKINKDIEKIDASNKFRKAKSNKFKCVEYNYINNEFNEPFMAYITADGDLWVSADINYTQQDMLNYIKDCQFVYELPSPQYEQINYNPLEVYSDVTHITTNSAIPTNIVVKNHGYNLVALKENTQYTLYVNKDTTNALTYRLGDYVEINSLSKFTFTTPSTLTDKTLRIDGKGAKVNDLMLIEGTPTNDSIGYFDGLKSSYECEQVTDENDVNYGKYKVDIKVVGKNLCPNKFYSGWSDRLGTLYSDDNVVSELIKVKPNSNYTINKENFSYLFKYDSNKKFIGQEVVFQTFNTKNAVYIRMAQSIGASDIHLENYDNTIQIEEGDIVTEYEPYFESKQTIYLNSPLLKGDEIVWKDNKIQHYHKMETIVLDGSDDEGWGSIEFKTNNIKVGRAFNSAKYFALHKCPLKCDNFITQSAIFDESLYEMATIYGHSETSKELRLSICKSKLQTQDLQGFKQWLQQNPTTVVYPLKTPYYEEISDYPLKLNVIANSSLSTESTIQVTNISFNIYEETLPYLYPNTKYYITFNADVDRNNIIINLGGNHVVFDCKVGFNKVEITTPSDTTNLLTFSGTGVNIDHVKVTQQDIDEYFEGMKSVGECEGNIIDILSRNSKNLIDIIPSNWEVGTIDGNNGQNVDSTIRIRTKSFMLLPKKQDYLYYKRFGSYKLAIRFYDKDYKMIDGANTPYEGFISQDKISIPNGAFYYKLVCSSIEEVNILPNEIVNNQCYLGTEKTPTSYIEPKLNKQQLSHEPLRAVGESKDRYVMVDGKWYIERNCMKFTFNGRDERWGNLGYGGHETRNTFEIGINKVHTKQGVLKSICDKYETVETFALPPNDNAYRVFNSVNPDVNSGNAMLYFLFTPSTSIIPYRDTEAWKEWLSENPITIIVECSPSYEPIDYNPFEVYEDTTHITANSLIPTNVVVKNHGYNCILKPSTKYTIALNKPNGTISAKLGGSAKVDSTNSIFTITTPSTLSDNVLRLNGSGNVKDIMILEGDKTINTPSYFEGIESVFEQEYDIEKGKYRVTARVEGNGKESSITFYINEPLREVEDSKDKIFIKDGKVVVQRNCGYYIFNENTSWIGSDHVNRGHWIRVSDNSIPNYKPNLNPILSIPSISSPQGYPYWQNKDNEVEIFWDWSGTHMYIFLHSAKTKWDVKVNYGVDDISNYMKNNPIEMVYQLAEPVYEEADCDLSKLALENYENSSLIFESNIPVSANIRYSGEVPVVTQAKSLSSQVDNTTLDINENIIPYMCDIDYRIVELQLMNGDTQGEGIELLGIGNIEILGNENVLFNNREDKKYNYSYDMLKRDILSQRYSREEYQYRLDRYLLANKISNEEYKELEGLLNNGE